jgi:DNA-binding protein YbaB
MLVSQPSNITGRDLGVGVPSADGLLDPDGAKDRLTAWKGRIDQRAADTKAMSDRLEQLRITVADRRGLAEVTIDSTGRLLDLRLTPQIQRVAPDAAARTIMDTIHEAYRHMADRSQRIIADTVGTESAAGRALAERIGQRLRDTEPAERTAGDRDGPR